MLYATDVDPEGQQNSWRRSLTKHYDVIFIECFVHHSPPCILLPFWIRHCATNELVLRKLSCPENINA